jgi:hypothetical protein
VTNDVLKEIRGGLIDGRDALTDIWVEKSLKIQFVESKNSG